MNISRILTILTAMLAFNVASAETLTIVHTNDIDSRIESIDEWAGKCSSEDEEKGNCFGGYARLATAIRQIRDEVPNSLLLDAGSQFQGSIFHYVYKGQAAVEMMNTIGYDAMVAGNSEFTSGPKVLREFIDAADFPVVLTNADVSAEPELSDVLIPSTIIEVGGYRYGILGTAPHETPEIASPGPNIRFLDHADAILREIENLTEQGISRIILLSHVSHENDRKIAKEVDGIDVIVGSHSNTFQSDDPAMAGAAYPTWVESPSGNKIPIVHAYEHGKFLGRLDVTFDDSGMVTSAVGERLLMDSSVPEDPIFKARIAELAAPLAKLNDQVVAEAAVTIEGKPEICFTQQCEVGSSIADAMLEFMRPRGSVIAIVNGGGIRASIEKGPITWAEIRTTLPFQNAISKFKLSGADIVASLENGVSRIEDAQFHGRFPQVAGIRFTYTLSNNPGERVIEVEVLENGQWAAIDPDRVYGVTTIGFLRSGGDGYELFATNAIDPFDGIADVTEVFVEYLAAHSPFTPESDVRSSLK